MRSFSPHADGHPATVKPRNHDPPTPERPAESQNHVTDSCHSGCNPVRRIPLHRRSRERGERRQDGRQDELAHHADRWRRRKAPPHPRSSQEHPLSRVQAGTPVVALPEAAAPLIRRANGSPRRHMARRLRQRRRSVYCRARFSPRDVARLLHTRRSTMTFMVAARTSAQSAAFDTVSIVPSISMPWTTVPGTITITRDM
jgi:hypothetical protein